VSEAFRYAARRELLHENGDDEALSLPRRTTMPMSYMLTVATALIRESVSAAASLKKPLPQIPINPMRSRSTNALVPKKSTVALKSSMKSAGDIDP
jgi:hypothetical protein